MVGRTSEAEIRPEEQSEKAESFLKNIGRNTVEMTVETEQRTRRE